jgi:hypothetical protein
LIVNKPSYKAPIMERMINASGALTQAWSGFMRLISDALTYLGRENSFALVNNTAVAANIEGLKFDYRYTSACFVEYLIQRVTSTTVKLQAGIKIVVFNPDTLGWTIAEYGTSGPDAAGITFTITATGQVQYTSTNLGGTEELSRIVWRQREIAAKSSLYSRVG